MEGRAEGLWVKLCAIAWVRKQSSGPVDGVNSSEPGKIVSDNFPWSLEILILSKACVEIARRQKNNVV